MSRKSRRQRAALLFNRKVYSLVTGEHISSSDTKQLDAFFEKMVADFPEIKTHPFYNHAIQCINRCKIIRADPGLCEKLAGEVLNDFHEVISDDIKRDSWDLYEARNNALLARVIEDTDTKRELEGDHPYAIEQYSQALIENHWSGGARMRVARNQQRAVLLDAFNKANPNDLQGVLSEYYKKKTLINQLTRSERADIAALQHDIRTYGASHKKTQASVGMLKKTLCGKLKKSVERREKRLESKLKKQWTKFNKWRDRRTKKSRLPGSVVGAISSDILKKQL